MPRQHRVLCVEDDPTARRVMEAFLSRQGYEVLTAGDGAEALETIDLTPPDLILLDVMMPGMSGYEVCAQLQRHPEHAYIPIIFITALAEEEERERAFAAGGVDFLTKPVQRARLLQKVAAHLETSDDWANLRHPTEEAPAARTDFAAFLAYLARQQELSRQDGEVLASATPATIFLDAAASGFDPDAVSRYMADFLGVSFVGLLDGSRLALGVLPALLCAQREILPLEQPSGELDFAVCNPFDPQVATLLDRCVGQGAKARIHVTTADALFSVLSEHEAAVRRKTTMPVEEPADRVERLIGWILEVAAQTGATEIHLEPWDDEVALGFRVGDKVEVMRTLRPRGLIRPLLQRLKVAAGLDLTMPRFRSMVLIEWRHDPKDPEPVRFRAEFLPMIHGEKALLYPVRPEA